MRTLIQRVQHASVTIDGQLNPKSGKACSYWSVLKTATHRKISNGCAKDCQPSHFDDETAS